jgi:hypothetical protein
MSIDGVNSSLSGEPMDMTLKLQSRKQGIHLSLRVGKVEFATFLAVHRRKTSRSSYISV